MKSPKSGLNVDIFRLKEGAMGKGRENRNNLALTPRLLSTVLNDNYFGNHSGPLPAIASCADKWPPFVAPPLCETTGQPTRSRCGASVTWATWQYATYSL
ncbi:hypothetical protein Y032_0372g163 [Ancylostoma ceylanicum]|uniref:Uncharacterized protein n=1 Tax=Ancylostoma ceylanicum TaxID=53326 RepID=A0A016RUA6_9BILA|nr:hypothetical protein Y032_0372g163 [Ancylostoma ceylanicum]